MSHEYSFFCAIVTRLIDLKTLKSQKEFGALHLERLPGLCPRPQAAKAIALL